MNSTSGRSTPLRWTGYVISTLATLFLLTDGAMKLAKPGFVVERTKQLGYSEHVIIGLGFVLTACALLYAFPRTAMLGAILLTGYLGGAVATHVRAGSSTFETVFPTLVGALVWGGLLLRDGRLRALFPLRR